MRYFTSRSVEFFRHLRTKNVQDGCALQWLDLNALLSNLVELQLAEQRLIPTTSYYTSSLLVSIFFIVWRSRPLYSVITVQNLVTSFNSIYRTESFDYGFYTDPYVLLHYVKDWFKTPTSFFDMAWCIIGEYEVKKEQEECNEVLRLVSCYSLRPNVLREGTIIHW